MKDHEKIKGSILSGICFGEDQRSQGLEDRSVKNPSLSYETGEAFLVSVIRVQ